MRVTVYFWAKPGEETFASCRNPSEQYIKGLVEEGWQFFLVEVELPVKGLEKIQRIEGEVQATPASKPS